MGFETFLFYCFAALVVGAAGMVITRRNPVHAVLWLVVAFVGSSALWILMEAEFLGIALVLVYVGAVMVLFLFVVMMLDIDIAAMREGFVKYLPIGVVVAVAMLVEIALVVGPWHFGSKAFPQPAPAGPEVDNTRELALMLFGSHLYPFELAAVILLVAIVAAIRLTLRRRADNRSPDPTAQVKVKKGPDRIRIVKMPAVGAVKTEERGQ